MNGVFDDLYQVAEECLSLIVRDPANRGRSWDRCYSFFQRYHQLVRCRGADLELACLHLGFWDSSLWKFHFWLLYALVEYLPGRWAMPTIAGAAHCLSRSRLPNHAGGRFVLLEKRIRCCESVITNTDGRGDCRLAQGYSTVIRRDIPIE